MKYGSALQIVDISKGLDMSIVLILKVLYYIDLHALLPQHNFVTTKD